MDKGVLSMLHWNNFLMIAGLFVATFAFSIFADTMNLKGAGIAILLLALSIGLLITSADFFIEGAKGLARRAGIAEVVIGLTIVSIGTSLPEILVSGTASWKEKMNPGAGYTDFALGNIFGSELVQITLILGLVVLYRPLDIRPSWLRRDGLIMLGAVLLLSLFIIVDGTLSRLEGALLSLLYIGYIFYLLRKREEIREEECEAMTDVSQEKKERDWSSGAYIIMILFGLCLAIYSSSLVVSTAETIAITLDVPQAIIGTTLAAIGTSLPELTVALMAAKKSQGVAIGTLVGSNITDPMLSIGLAALINPISVSAASHDILYFLIIPATIIGVSLALMFMWTDFKFNRWEGGILVSAYAVFLGALYLVM